MRRDLLHFLVGTFATVAFAGCAVVVSAVADWLLFITTAPTEPPINAAINATGKSLFVIIIALVSP